MESTEDITESAPPPKSVELPADKTRGLKAPWQPGQSGNPNGRPRKRPLSEAHDDVLRMELPMEVRVAMKLKAGATWADAIALGIARKAVAGDVSAAKEMREAVEGKATQRIELVTPEDRGFDVNVRFEAAVPERRIERAVEERVIEAVAVVAATQLDDEKESEK